MLNRNGADALDSLEILEDNGHVKVLETIADPLEVDSLNIVKVYDEEGLLTDRYDAEWRRPQLDDGLDRAPFELDVLQWDVQRDRLLALLDTPLALLLD
jgi:hypothetical protein